MPASSSPAVLPVPLSVLAAIDPEEALVAAASSCHMLFFLAIAAKRGFTIDRYHDQAFGNMGKNAAGRTFMSTITLCPQIDFIGEKQPTADDIKHLHEEAHKQCFIGNSLLTEIIIEPK